MDDNIRNLIFQAIDQTISKDDFERLQDAMQQHHDVRAEYLRAVNLCESLSDIATEGTAADSDVSVDANASGPRESGDRSQLVGSRADASNWDLRSPMLLTVAATTLLVVSGVAFWLGQRNVPGDGARVVEERSEETTEVLIAGHATLRHSVDLTWSDRAPPYRDGDVLPNGLLQFDNGVAEIDFFCGATLIVEGPATLDVESDWSVRVVKGRLRAHVPPAARGFVVKAAGAEIVDLGTEFALEVGAENARVEVIDGEVELRGGQHDGKHLITGERRWLNGTRDQPAAFEGLSTVNDVQRRREHAEAQRFGQWKRHSQQFRSDDRLIAYYPVTETLAERVVRNAAPTGGRFDGQLVGPVDRTAGRFGSASAGLEFGRPGTRIRTRIDGEFQAFTFMCWARIDSLEHRYNALFMGDGYENGEPHWQIRDDGRLMFSVMVDDTPGAGQGKAADARLHQIYFSEPIWDVAMSGQWLHLSAVYDPVARQVSHYLNGEQISREEITDKFHVTALRIGPAEIGNWGQPLRNSPWFAVRNLNGTIDELAIFDAALTPAEIQALYEQGKPLGY